MYAATHGADILIPTALRKAKIAYNFGLSGCNRVNKKHPNPIKILYTFACTTFLRETFQENFTLRILPCYVLIALLYYPPSEKIDSLD